MVLLTFPSLPGVAQDASPREPQDGRARRSRDLVPGVGIGLVEFRPGQGENLFDPEGVPRLRVGNPGHPHVHAEGPTGDWKERLSPVARLQQDQVDTLVPEPALWSGHRPVEPDQRAVDHLADPDPLDQGAAPRLVQIGRFCRCQVVVGEEEVV